MARWDLNRGLYALATGVFRFNYLPLVAIALAQAALQSLPLVAGEGGVLAAIALLGASLLQVALLYLTLFTLMTGGRVVEHPFPWPNFWGFFGRLLLLGLPAAVAMMAALASDGAVFGFLSLAISLAILGLFGTMLPDVVAGGPGRVGEALERGRRSFGKFLTWMLAGPVLASVALGLGFGVVSALLLTAGIGTAGAGDEAQLSPWFLGLFTLLGSIGGAYVAALTAAALAKAWAAGGGTLSPRRPR